jgi:16S rRNA processing protein RimM
MTGERSDQPNQQKNPSGSPQSGEPEFLAIGKLRRPHGVKGLLIMDILTDFPERMRAGKPVFLGEDHRPIQLASIRRTGKTMLVGFAGIEDRDQAGELRNQIVFVKTASVPRLPQGEYYHHQLLGLTVVDEAGNELGKLEEILETRANDVYLLRREDGSEQLLPAVEGEVVLGVDLERRLIRVRPPQWD